MVLEAIVEIVGRRADLHQVGDVPGPAQGHGRLVEQEVDVDRAVLLAVAARLRLLDDPHDRRVLLGERRLVREIGARERREGERGRYEHADQPRASQSGGSDHPSGFDAKRSIPRCRERNFAAS